MVEQLPLVGLDGPADLCACGCGRPLPPSPGRGRPARFATQACKQAAYRLRWAEAPEGLNFVTAPTDTLEGDSPPASPAGQRSEAVVEADGAASVACAREPAHRVDLRSPYSSAEWQGIVAALRAERARRKVEHLPRADQMAIVDEVLLAFRRPS